MIQFDKVKLSFGGQLLFQDVSFTLQKGERCGLVGRNGSGKSTLLKMIAKEMEPDDGSVSLSKNYRVGFLRQHIHFTKPTILEEAASALPPGEEDHLYKAEKILFGLGFSEKDMDASISQFSGGYHLRLHLAKVLISEPDCLLLDEPTNYLDIPSIRWLKQFLRRWRGEFLLITHDRDFMDEVTTHTMGIHRGGVKKLPGDTKHFFEQLLLEEEVHEKTRVKVEKKKAHAEDFIRRFGAKATKAGQAQSRVKMLARMPALEKLNAIANLSFDFHEAPFPGKKMLEAKDVSFSYTDAPLISDVSLWIEKGERVAIIGKNGRGKSTLLRLFAKDLQPIEGSVEHSENAHIGYFGQTHIDHLHANHTIEEEINEANPKLKFAEIKAIAGVMMFSGDASKKKISFLSGGEKSRVLLGKILAKPCNLLMLDEPTHHLDIESIEALIDALEEFSGSVVIVTHSELILRRLLLDKIILCGENKQTYFLGTYDEFLEKVGWDEEEKVAPKKKEEIVRPVNLLKPLETEIKKKEEKIMALEKEQKQDQIAIEKGETNPLFLKSYGQRQKEIEKNYAELEQLYQNYEMKKRESK